MYTLIDYKKWNPDGKGKNIINMLTTRERELWKKALRFQDKRNDAGHVEVATYFALQLLPHIAGDRKIVVPAIILHDTGWSQMSEVELKLFYDKHWKDYEPVSRARHQEEGARKAREILAEVGHYEASTPIILDIISQHDTRKGFLNLEDGIVRDADKLWRVTLPHLKIAMKERGWTVEEVEANVVSKLNKKGFLYSPVSRELATLEWANCLRAFHEGL